MLAYLHGSSLAATLSVSRFPYTQLLKSLRLTYVTESQGMNIYIDPSTNMGLPQFTPTDTYQYVGFDSDNKMYIRSYLDDTTNPPTGNTRKRYYRWYMCQSYYTGYQYNQLNWLYGKGPPQNPSCKKVSVERVFVN